MTDFDAYWIATKKDKTHYTYTCSKCGKTVWNNKGIFCPKCGRRMCEYAERTKQ